MWTPGDVVRALSQPLSLNTLKSFLLQILKTRDVPGLSEEKDSSQERDHFPDLRKQPSRRAGLVFEVMGGLRREQQTRRLMTTVKHSPSSCLQVSCFIHKRAA